MYCLQIVRSLKMYDWDIYSINICPFNSPEEMRELLQQMQHTTTLLLNRMGQFTSAPPQSRLAATRPTSPLPAVVQSPTLAFPTAAPQMQSGSCHLPAPPSHTPPAARCHIPPVPSSRTPPISTSHFPAVPPRSTVYQPRPDNVQVHLSRLFRPHQRGSGAGARKRKRETPWSHTFICLPDRQWSSMPTVEEARYYSSCGLGRKTVWFPHNEGDHSFFSEHLLSAFPPLRDAGGFLLARGSRGKALEEISIPPEGYSLSFVRSACTRAPLYIIPLQRSLTLTPPPVDEVGFEPSSMCAFYCMDIQPLFIYLFILQCA